MLISFLISLLLAVPVAPTAMISGKIATPQNGKITKPVQVAVFSGPYVNLYLADLQRRIDNYWEDYKSAFIEDKTAFFLFRVRAQRQAMDFTIDRMRRDDPRSTTAFIQTTNNSTFEFRNVPVGESRVVALVTIGNQEFVWSESVILTDGATAFVTLKPTNP